MSSVPILYRVLMRAASLAAPLLSLGGSKLARGSAGRRRAPEVLARWGEGERDLSRPAVWFHAPSVGEALQASAVITALAEQRPGVQVAFTHFSPSAEGIGRHIGADVATYLPWDVPSAVRRALDGIRPDLLVFTKTEVWPVLVEEAVRRGVLVALVAGSVRPGAGRMSRPARALLRPTWASLSLACAGTDQDAAALVALGVPESVVRTTGDPGVDAAARRADAANRASPSLAPFFEDKRPTVVAGSTWPSDEEVLLPALADVRTRVRGLRVVIAPHEPSPVRVRDLLERLSMAGWKCATHGEVENKQSANGTNAIVVERVGLLATLYSVADVAYVGGGFARNGLHSVLEPAAARVPIVFGPHHFGTAAAGALVATGGASVVTSRSRLAAAVTIWLTDPDARGKAAKHAFTYIEDHLGAAARTAAFLDPLIESKKRSA